MADFNVSTPPVPNQAPPQQGVMDNSVAQGINLFSDVLGSVGGTLANAAASAKKTAATAQVNKVLDTFEQNLLRVADLHDQGVMNQDAARRRYRVLTAQVLANNPSIRDEINSVYQKVISTTGLGKNVDVGTNEEQRYKGMVDAATKAGMIPASVDPYSEQGRQLVDAYQRLQQHATVLASAKSDLDYKRAQIGYQTDQVQFAAARQSYVTGGITQQTARLTLAEKQAEVVARSNLTGMAGAFQTMTTAKFNDIQQRFASGQIDAKQAGLETDQAMAEANSILNKSGQAAGGDYINNLLKPVQTQAQALKDYVSGKISADEAQNVVKQEIARTQLQQIHNHPDVLPYIAASKLLPQLPTEIQATLSSKAIDILKLGSQDPSTNNKTPDLTVNDSNKQDVKPVFDVLKNGLRNYSAGISNEGTIKELANNLRAAVVSTAKYAATTDSPKELQPLIDLFASPEFGKFNKDGKIPLDQTTHDQAVKAMDQYYNAKVIPVLEQEYFKKTDTPMGHAENLNPFSLAPSTAVNVDGKPYSQKIKTVVKGDAVQFVPNDPKDQGSVSAANDLNKTVSPVLSKMVRASANLSGDSFQTTYEQMMSQLDPPTSIPNTPQPNPIDLGIKPLDLSSPDYGPSDAPGMVQQGNIDLNSRPVVDNKDGSFSTVRSISIGTDKGEVLIPTVIGNKVVSNEEAIAHYEKTGENLGIFKSVSAANLYAEKLHNEQAKLYSRRK